MSTQSDPAAYPAQAASVSPDPLEQTATPATSEHRLASVAERGGALLLDGLILLAMAAMFAVLFGDGTLDSDSTTDEDRVGVNMTVGDMFARPVLLSWFVYLIATEALFGATLGKRFTGYRTIRSDGSKLTVRPAVLRQLTHLLPIVVIANPVAFAVFVVEAIVAKRSQNRQRLGDHLAGTIVVRRAANT